MEDELYINIAKLPLEDRRDFNKRLVNILNDRYSSFIYGGVEGKEYADPPEQKKYRIKENLYNEMFRKISPPRMIARNLEFNMN